MSTGLPEAVEAERVTLGSILANGSLYLDAASVLDAADFSLESHVRIFRRMADLAKRGEEINYTTVFYELSKYKEQESVGGLSYLTSLTSGIPDGHKIDSYARLVKDKSRLRKVIFTCESIRNRAMAGVESSEDILGEATQSIFKLTEAQNGAGGAEDVEGIIEEAGGISAFLAPKEGIASPWPEFNAHTGGWQAGDLVLIAARPSMGKTAFALNAIWHAAVRNVPAVFYSYEMDKQSILRRLISLMACTPYLELIRGNGNGRKVIADAVAEVSSKPIKIIGASGWTALKLRMHMERLKRRGSLSIAAVDYIGLMKPMPGTSQNRTQELGETCRLLKEAAGELKVPLLVLSQLNRAVEMRTDRIPVMADLRDSGELENHADLIAFLHRPGYYHRDQASLQLKANLIVAKQRNGACPTIELQFRQEYGHFYQVDYGMEEK